VSKKLPCVLCLQVTMVDRSAAERICKDPNPIIDGRKANVNLAYLGAKPRIQATELLGTVPTIYVYISEICRQSIAAVAGTVWALPAV